MLIFIKILLIIWELPQILLGFIILKICLIKHSVKIDGKESFIFYISEGISSGISLGPNIILNPKYDSPFVRKHEKGHSIQSIILGPFYLLLIGIPSIIGYLTIKDPYKYFQQPWEKWANNLSKIEYNKTKGWMEK